MKRRTITAWLLALALVFSSLTTPASALEWEGSSEGGGGGGRSGDPSGFSLKSTNLNNCTIGYRFSLVNDVGDNKTGKVIDVFRNTTYGNGAYSNNYSFKTKMNKKQLINGQNSGFGTKKTTTNCYKETDMSFSTTLPQPSGMEIWQDRKENLNAVLSKLNAGDISQLEKGDKILVEPLWDVRLEDDYHSLTVTEIALYGKHLLGANSDGGSSTVSESWGFISRFTNREFPNALYTEDGQGLWPGVNAIGSSSRATFKTLINKGYGVGIAYTEEENDGPSLAVEYCNAVKGGASSTTVFGKSVGNSFAHWTVETDYPIMGDVISFQVKFKAPDQTYRVRKAMRVDGGTWSTKVENMKTSASTQWYKVQFSSAAISAGKEYYTVQAKVDYLDEDNEVLKAGAVKTFYIPVRPKINRTQVALYDITGTLVAKNGSNGQSGRVYVGQKVYPKYTYTSTTTWTSQNNFIAKINGSSDISASGSISSSAAVVKNSSKSPYTVPNVTSLPHKLTTSWTSDPSRTTENTTIQIPVFKSDVALTEIRLIDNATGGYVTDSHLWVHQQVTPQYTYKNNTDIPVYVEGYNDDRTRVGGSNAVYAIPANGEIVVNGKTITIPNQASVSIWGGVFLDGAGLYNTSWETVGSNNTRTITFDVRSSLSIEYITPNSLYREETDVVTSFRARNAASFHITPYYSVSVRFYAYSGGRLLHSATKSGVVVPAYGDNLVYFKWTVPAGLNGADIQLRAEIYEGGELVGIETKTQGTEKKPVSQTPNTVFEKDAPSGFSVVSVPNRTDMKSALWSEWVYEYGGFVKKTYGLNLNSAGVPVLTPDPNSPSRELKNGVWTMKSGYGYSVQWNVGIQTLSGTLTPSASAYTNAQLALLYFPEFKYSTARYSFRVLEQAAVNSFRLPTNNAAKNNGRIHFIPLWYPDGNYITQGYTGDVWTPAGMMSGYMQSAPVEIAQSAYDDWYLGR